MTFAAILWISNFIGSARILAKNRDDFQKAGYSHHTYFFPSPLQKTTMYGSRNYRGGGGASPALQAYRRRRKVAIGRTDTTAAIATLQNK